MARMMGGEKALAFGPTMKRMLAFMGQFKGRLLLVLLFAIASTAFSIVGPKVLSEATTVLFDGAVASAAGTGSIDFDAIGRILLATLALFIGVGKWNDWFTGAYYQSKAALYPAATVLQKILSEATASSQVKVGQETALGSMTSYTSQSLQMAFVMILTMPIVIIYPFLQKYYVKGVMVGSVKG